MPVINAIMNIVFPIAVIALTLLFVIGLVELTSPETFDALACRVVSADTAEYTFCRLEAKLANP